MSTEYLKDSDIRDAANAVFAKYVEAIKDEFGSESDNADNYRARTNQIIRKAEETKRKRRAGWQAVLRKVAVVLLVICLGAGSVLVFSEDARAMVRHWYKSVFENKVVYNNVDTKEPDGEITDTENTEEENVNAGEEEYAEMGFPVFDWIPEGFELLSDLTIDDESWCEVTYKDSADNYFSFDCYKTGTVERLDLNAEGNNVETVSINGTKGDYYNTIFTSDASVLVWIDEKTESLCILGSSLDKDTMVKIAESLKYDREHELSVTQDISAQVITEGKGTIDQDALEKYGDILDRSMKEFFELYKESYSAVEGFELEAFYESFEIDILSGMKAEVYDFNYSMKAGEDMVLAGGMHRDDDGLIRSFNGSWGQIAVLKRGDEVIKVMPVTGMDIAIDLTDADDTMIAWARDRIITALKNPRYVTKEFLYN